MRVRHVIFVGAILSTQAGRSCGSSETEITDAGPDAVPDASSDAPPIVVTECDNTEPQTGCVAKSCTVTATGSPLAKGETLTVKEKTAPSDLSGDALGGILRSIEVQRA